MSEIVIGETLLKHYVVWFGQDGCASAFEETDSRDPSTLYFKTSAACFLIYDRIELTCIVDGEDVRASSECFNFSPRYVPGGRIVTGEERYALYAPGGSLDRVVNPARWEIVVSPYLKDVVAHPGSCVLLPLAETVG